MKRLNRVGKDVEKPAWLIEIMCDGVLRAHTCLTNRLGTP